MQKQKKQLKNTETKYNIKTEKLCKLKTQKINYIYNSRYKITLNTKAH